MSGISARHRISEQQLAQPRQRKRFWLTCGRKLWGYCSNIVSSSLEQQLYTELRLPRDAAEPAASHQSRNFTGGRDWLGGVKVCRGTRGEHRRGLGN